MAKGIKTGGRKKGVPNKITSAGRTAFLATFGKLEGELEGWIRTTAEGVPAPVIRNGSALLDEKGKPIMFPAGADPGRAADLMIRMAQYHFPKLGNTELTGKDGGPLEIVIKDLGKS